MKIEGINNEIDLLRIHLQIEFPFDLIDLQDE